MEVGELDLDINKAIKWRQEAAQQGYAPAQHRLGIIYQKGKEVDQNLGEAFRWYSRAVKQGYVPTQLFLALMYLNGYGEINKGS